MGFLRELAGAFAAGYRGEEYPPPPAAPPPSAADLIAGAEQQAAATVAAGRARGQRYVQQLRSRYRRLAGESAARIERIRAKQKSGWE